MELLSVALIFIINCLHFMLLKKKRVPRLFALLPNKTEDAYAKLFSTLKNLYPALTPESLMKDFEKSSLNAFECFSECRDYLLLISSGQKYL